MTGLVYNRPERRQPARITDDLETRVLEALRTSSQQQVARQLGLSQSTVSRIARRHVDGGAHA